MKGFRFELDRVNIQERKWSISEATDGSLVVTAFSFDEEQCDQVVLERFNHFLSVRPRETTSLPVTIVAECVQLHGALIRGGMDPTRVPPTLVPRWKVIELYSALKITEPVPPHGTAEIMGAVIAWHEDLDVTVARRL